MTMTAQVADRETTPTGSDYSRLLAEVRRASLLDRSPSRYVPRALTMAALVAAGVVAMFWLNQSWWQLAVAAYFAVVFAQLGFLGHDAGHQQIFRSRRWNDGVGRVISNLGIGLSYGWWVDKHNRHHAVPNDVRSDPDVQRNVLAWTDAQAGEQRGVFRLIAQHQRAMFVLLLAFEAINLHVGSARSLLAEPAGRRYEILLLVAHLVLCSALLLAVMSPLHALAFAGVQQGLLGIYLGLSFAPNHKGMPTYDGDAPRDFLRRQVLASRNVSGGRLIGVALGNLNYQIEHHLFPSMPSRQLRRCQPIVQRFCATHDVSYAEATLTDSYARVLGYLHSVRPPA